MQALRFLSCLLPLWVGAAVGLAPTCAQGEQARLTGCSDIHDRLGIGYSCCDAAIACEVCWCEPLPTFTAWADWVYIRRDQRGSDTLLLNDDLLPEFPSGALDFDYQSGIDTGLIYWCHANTGIEFRYFWVDDWSAAATVPNPGLLNLATVPPTGAFAANFAVDYRSELQTAEVNVRHRTGCITWLAGFRYAELNEELNLNGLAGQNVVASNSRFMVGNDLFGFQLGGDAALWEHGSFRLNALGKAGVYHNDASGSSRLNLGALPTTLGSGRDTARETAFLAELGVNGTMQLTRHVALRAGYRVLYVDGVATAGGLVQNTGNLTAGANQTPIALAADHSLLYHGANVGLEFTW